MAALVLTPTALAEASASAAEAALLVMLDLEEPKAGADRARRRAAPITADLRGGRRWPTGVCTNRATSQQASCEVFEALIGVMPYVVAVRA